MSNPFEALDISDDEDDQQFVNAKGEQKVRKSTSFILFSPQGEKIIEEDRHPGSPQAQQLSSQYWNPSQSQRQRQGSQT